MPTTEDYGRMPAVKSWEKNGFKVSIFQDENPESPREWTNTGTMVCFHRRYNLGDEGHGLREQNFHSWSEVEQHLREAKGAVVILPMYMYDHSGLRVNTTGFSCPWDSGQIGFVYADRKACLEALGTKRLTAAGRMKVHRLLMGEVETYDQFLSGDVYGYTVEDGGGEAVKSCWGYYGIESAESAANEAVPAGTKVTYERKA